jgi:hypothetical protein
LEGESAPMRGRKPVRLFVGEDDATDDLKEVATWIQVYAELADFCQRAMAEQGGTPKPPLEEWNEHFNSRLEHWRHRREELLKTS